MVKVAVVTRSQNSSPRVLAESLNMMVPLIGNYSKVFYSVNTFKRLLKYKSVNHKYNYPTWLIYKLLFFVSDKFFLMRLKAFDAIIISDSTPYGFLPDTYNIERLKDIIGNIPILFYEVYYLGNAPTQLEMLKKKNCPAIERYNWHLSITDVTEIKTRPSPPWSQIGLYLKGSGLAPNVKKQFMAVVDFAQPGNEHFRKEQIQVLEELNIPYLSLEKRYTITEIQKIYQEATFYFMQSSESFGLPIAECLCCGSYVFTPDSSWPMSWRLDENPEVHGSGLLPECFVVYKEKNDLETKLKEIIKGYDFIATPKKVFDIFYKHYPSFYEGNLRALNDVFKRIEENRLQ